MIKVSTKGKNEKSEIAILVQVRNSSLEDYFWHIKIPVENLLKGIQNSNDGPLIKDFVSLITVFW